MNEIIRAMADQFSKELDREILSMFTPILKYEVGDYVKVENNDELDNGIYKVYDQDVDHKYSMLEDFKGTKHSQLVHNSVLKPASPLDILSRKKNQ